MPQLFAPKLRPLSKRNGPLRLFEPRLAFPPVETPTWPFDPQPFQPPHPSKANRYAATKGKS